MNGAAHPSLPTFWQQVANAPHAYDLYALLRWLDARSGMPARLGHAIHPGDEPLRIGQQPSLVFAPATLASATRRLKARRRACRSSASACSAPTVRCRFI